MADPEMVKEHLRQMKNIGLRYIDFTGGEPLLHPQLPKLLEYAGELGFHTTITTNCLLYPKKAEEIKGLVDFLHFSLDSADRNQHDAIRGVKCFDKVMESINIAKRLGERPDFLMTLTEDNVNQIDPLWELVSSEEMVLILNPVFDYCSPGGSDYEMAWKLMNIPSRKYLYNNKAFLRLRLEGGNDRSKPRCRAVSATMAISPWGELLLPCFHHAVAKISLEEGIDSARSSTIFHQALENQGRYEFCQRCAINCYFDPSFLYLPDKLMFHSLMAKAKYVYDKFITS